MAKSNGMKDKVRSGADTSRGKANGPKTRGNFKPMKHDAPVHFADKGKPKK